MFISLMFPNEDAAVTQDATDRHSGEGAGLVSHRQRAECIMEEGSHDSAVFRRRSRKCTPAGGCSREAIGHKNTQIENVLIAASGLCCKS